MTASGNEYHFYNTANKKLTGTLNSETGESQRQPALATQCRPRVCSYRSLLVLSVEGKPPSQPLLSNTMKCEGGGCVITLGILYVHPKEAWSRGRNGQRMRAGGAPYSSRDGAGVCVRAWARVHEVYCETPGCIIHQANYYTCEVSEKKHTPAAGGLEHCIVGINFLSNGLALQRHSLLFVITDEPHEEICG